MSEAHTDGASAGPDLFSAVGRHFLWFLLPILILAAAGIGYGQLRHAQYTAQTKVSIGQLDLTTQGFPSFLTAASNLAAAYARTIDAPQVAQAAARAAHVSTSAAHDALSASAISDTPLFLIEAKTTSARTAVALANGASTGLVHYILNLNIHANIRSKVLGEYQSAALKVAQLRRELRLAGTRPKAVGLDQRFQVATLRLNTLGALYGVSAGGEVTQNLLQIVVSADHATSDRTSTTEEFALIGAVVGLLIGLMLAAGRASALDRRTVPA